MVTNNEALHDKLIRLRSHGITRDPALMKGKSDGGWYYQQLELGFNYRMTDLQAALGISQMSRLDAFVARRNELAGRYDEALSGLPVRLPFQDPGGYSAFHLYVIRVLSNQRDLVFDTLRKENILVNVHYIPVHLQPYYRELGFSAGDFPEAEHYYKETISLPLFPKLSEHQQDTVISCLKKVLS